MISSFSSTFQDDLIERPLLVGPAEKIYYFEDPEVSPVNIAGAQPIPIGWRREADLLIRNLLKYKIIERITHVTTWCSARGFVPKPSGRGLRLATDYRAINKCIGHSHSPFPDVETLETNIPSDTKFLTKIDYASGYYHVGLEEESRDLMFFIVP